MDTCGTPLLSLNPLHQSGINAMSAVWLLWPHLLALVRLHVSACFVVCMRVCMCVRVRVRVRLLDLVCCKLQAMYCVSVHALLQNTTHSC